MNEFIAKNKSKILLVGIALVTIVAGIAVKTTLGSGELTTTVSGSAKVDQDNSKTVTSEVSNDNLQGSTKLGNIGSVGGNFTLDQSKSEDSSTESHTAK